MSRLSYSKLPHTYIQQQKCWSPLLEGKQANEAWMAVNAIAHELREWEDPNCDASLARGHIGIAILFKMMAVLCPGQRYEHAVKHHLKKSLEFLESSQTSPWFFTGYPGVAWGADWLGSTYFPNDEDPCAEIDEILLRLLKAAPWSLDYDLVKGITGIGIYAINRLNRQTGPMILNKVLQHLESLAVDQPVGRSWLTPPHLLVPWQAKEFPNGYYNLGLAHGVPSVIVFLAQVIAHGHGTRSTKKLLNDAVKWLLAQRKPEGSICFFDHLIPVGQAIPERESRIAWCYGDLGLSAALYWAGVTLNQFEWKSFALELALDVAERPFEKSRCEDAGLCHGASGIALIFNRFFQATGLIEFRETSLRWYAQALRFRGPNGIGGFQVYRGLHPGFSTPWTNAAGIIDGSAGIALSLLAGLTASEPTWDTLLQTSMPPIQISS